MNDNYPVPWQDSDFSILNETISRIREITRSAQEMMQNLQDILRPLFETIEQYKPNIIAIGAALSGMARSLSAIGKLGDAQFVYWDYLPPEFVDAIVDSKNTNKTLRELLEHDRFRKVNDTVNQTLAHPMIRSYKRLYMQCVKAFQNGNRDLAVLGFVSIFDGLLSDISKNPTHSLKPRIDAIKQKLDKKEILNSDEHAVLTLAVTVEKTLDTFAASSDFNGKEPKGLNRHWIAHGRSLRRKTKLDCVKMINLIYGLLLIEELDTTGETEPND